MPNDLTLPARETPAPWPGWTGVRRPASGSWVPDKHETSGAQARIAKLEAGR